MEFASAMSAVKCGALDFTASWLAYVASLFIAHPIDTLRVRWQTLRQPPAVTIRRDGVRSLFAGIMSPMFGLGPMIAFIFAASDACREALRTRRWLRSDDSVLLPCGYTAAEVYLAGFVAGGLSSFGQGPVNFVRTQQQNSARGGAPAITVRAVLRTLRGEEGVLRGVYRGLVMELAQNSVGRGVYFTAYESLKVPNVAWLGATGVWAASLQTCVVWWLSVFPLDVVRTKLQADALRRADRRFAGSAAVCFRVTVKEHGWRGLYAGLWLSMARSLASSGTALPLYDWLRPRLRAWGGVRDAEL